MLMNRQCECGSFFRTTKKNVRLCPTCRYAIKPNQAETRRIREFLMRGSHTETEWMFQIERQMGLCFYCSIPLRDETGRWRGTRDHLTPVCKGGTDNIDNIVAACWPCNKRKGKRTLGEYRAYIDRQCGLISESSVVKAYKNLPVSTEEWPTVCVLNPELQEPFMRLMAKQEAAALAFKGMNVIERRKEIQTQKSEVNRRFA